MLKVAVIGTGQIANEHLRFLSENRGIHRTAVCDLSAALAGFYADRFHFNSAYTDYRRMIHDTAPEVVHVLTPPHTHVPIIHACLESGAHVIAEKPATPTHRELMDLLELARAKERLLIEDHNYLFNRPVPEMKRLVRNGTLGDLKEIEVRMSMRVRDSSSRYADLNLPHPSHRLPAGVIHEFITHLCSLALHFMPVREDRNGPGFDHIHAVWNNYGGGDLFKYDDLDALIIDRGVHTRIRFSHSQWPECFLVSVRGTKGCAKTDLFQPFFHLETPQKIKELTPILNQFKFGWHLIGRSGKNLLDKVRQAGTYHGLSIFLAQTYQALSNGTEPPVSRESMDRVSLLADRLIAEAKHQ